MALEQEPDLESALLSVQERSGYVLAMLGGYSYDRSEFNRSMQACRQPGSSFKPIIYTAALDLKQWTASTKVLDAPVTFDDTDAQKRWKPNNFSEKFMAKIREHKSAPSEETIKKFYEPFVRGALGLDSVVPDRDLLSEVKEIVRQRESAAS